MIPVRSSLKVEERLKRVQMADGHWGMLDPRTGIFTYEPPGPITFIEFTFHIDFSGDDTGADSAGGEEPDDDACDGRGDVEAPEGGVPDVRDSLEPINTPEPDSGT